MKNFTIKRYKKDGKKMIPVRVKDGIWVEPHSEEEYNKNIEANKLKDKQSKFMYYPGTKVPHIHYMEAKKYDKYGYLSGGPMPWCKLETIETNKELLATEGLYEKLAQAEKDDDKEQLRFLTRPLLVWIDPCTGKKNGVYAQAVTITNRNNKSNYVYKNLDRFEQAVKDLETLYLEKRISTKTGICALINLLSYKLAFRVGNNENPKSGVGVTTFRIQHIEFEQDYNNKKVQFKFKGKKGVQWNKTLNPKNELEECMVKDVKELWNIYYNCPSGFLFQWGGKRITSADVNELFRKILKVTPDEELYLSFHSWRHYLASKAFLKELDKIKIKKDIKKIEEKNDINSTIRKGRLITRELNKVFKKVSKVLNDTAGVVSSTYAGGKIFRDFYNKYGVEFDEKKRSWSKEAHSDEVEAEKERKEQRKIKKEI